MLDTGSRYLRTAPYLDDRGTLCLSIRRRFTFDLTKAQYYRVKQGDTVDGISYKYYKTELLWWAIMDANSQYMSELDMKVGDVIAIPDYQEVVSVSAGIRS